MDINLRRAELIKKHFFEFSFRHELDETEADIVPDFDVFTSLTSYEQYFLASFYNWDDGVIVLDWIIDSTICDKGTAAMIFWMAEPDFYFDYTEETIADYEKEVFDLLQKILLRFKTQDFIYSSLGFNPKDEGYKTDWENAKGIWELPEELTKGVPGITPNFFDLELDDSDKKLLNDINEYGWHVVKVMEDEKGPGFCYSVGLFETFRHPEIIIVGLKLDLAHILINNIGEAVKKGIKYQPLKYYNDILDDFQCKMVKVEMAHYKEYVGYALWYYSDEKFPLLQCVYPTTSGLFPWDSDWPKDLVDLQPILGKI